MLPGVLAVALIALLSYSNIMVRVTPPSIPLAFAGSAMEQQLPAPMASNADSEETAVTTPSPKSQSKAPAGDTNIPPQTVSSERTLLEWSGGGVKGQGEESYRAFVSSVFRDMTRRLRELNLPPWESLDDSASADALAQMLVNVTGVLASVARSGDLAFPPHHSTEVDTEENERGDCRYFLLPHQAAYCLMMAAMEEAQIDRPDKHRERGNSSNAWIDADLFERLSIRHSLCSLQLGCVFWQRGRFSTRLTPKYLDDVFNTGVVKKMKRNVRSSSMLRRHLVFGHRESSEGVSSRFLRNHPGLLAAVAQSDAATMTRYAEDAVKSSKVYHSKKVNNLTDAEKRLMAMTVAELPWLAQRVRAQLLDEKKRNQLLLKLPSIGKVHRVIPPTDVRAVFQGGEIGFEKYGKGIRRALDGSPTSPGTRSFVREKGSDRVSLVESFTSLETLAILWQVVARNEVSSDTCGKVPMLNIVLFQGDSLAREMFLRLVHHIRHGQRPPSNAASFTAFSYVPFFETAIHKDYVYAVYPDHDDLMMFQPPSKNNTTPRTVNRFFREEMAQRRMNSTRTASGGVALMYMVFLWDPFTQRQRMDSLVPCTETGATDLNGRIRFLFYPQHAKINVTTTAPVVPFREMGMRIALHVNGALHWEKIHSEKNFAQWQAMMFQCTLPSNHTLMDLFGPADLNGVTLDWCRSKGGQQDGPLDRTLFYTITSFNGDPLQHGDKNLPQFFPGLISPTEGDLGPSFEGAEALNQTFRHEPNYRLQRLVRLMEWFYAAELRRLEIERSGKDGSTSKLAMKLAPWSRVRILDKGKLPYARDNLFPRMDGTHLACHVFTVLGPIFDHLFDGRQVLSMLIGVHTDETLRHLRVRPIHLIRRLKKILWPMKDVLYAQSGMNASVYPRDLMVPVLQGGRGWARPEFHLWDGCVDTGDLMLLQTVLYDVLST